MKNKIILPLIMFITVVIWSFFLFLNIEYEKIDPLTAHMVAQIEFGIQLLTIFLLYRLFKKVPSAGKTNFFILFFINCFLLIVDALFYIPAYLQSTYLQRLKVLNFILYYAPCIFYAVTAIIFLSRIILKNIINSGNASLRLFILFIVSIVIFYLYLSSIHYAYQVLSIQNMLQILLLFSEFILFDICLIGLIYAIDRSAFLMLMGFILLVTGDFFLTYTYISQRISNYLIIGEFLWCLGLLFLLFLPLSIKENKNYDITHWFRNDRAIKSRLSFQIYLISIICYLMIYFIGYFLQIIDKDFMVLFPVLTMVYSVGVVILSMIVSRKFEEPFQVLKSNIHKFLVNKESYNTHKFDIEEYEYLESFLVQLIKINNSHNQTYILFGNIAAKAVHDLGSPLMSINSWINSLNIKSDNGYDISGLRLSLKQVKEITNNLLIQYRNLTVKNPLPEIIIDKDVDKARYINIIILIKNIIETKNIEWTENPCRIHLDRSLLDNEIFLFSPVKIARVLSNLLNNSYESLTANLRDIYIVLDNNAKYLNISIIDKGIGIPENKLKDIINGLSLKHHGNGLGITSSIEYVKSLDGEFEITSKQGGGTTVKLSFLNKDIPIWYTKKVFYSVNSKFVVLDDEVIIHINLQKKLRKVGILSTHFMNSEEFSSFITGISDRQYLIFIIDLNLNDSISGLELIVKHNLQNNSNVYLMTFDADRLEVQAKVQEYGIKLIDKNEFDYIQFCKTF